MTHTQEFNNGSMHSIIFVPQFLQIMNRSDFGTHDLKKIIMLFKGETCFHSGDVAGLSASGLGPVIASDGSTLYNGPPLYLFHVKLTSPTGGAVWEY